MNTEDARYTKLVADLIGTTRGFLDWGEGKGFLTPDGLKFTIEARRLVVKKLDADGMSQRKIAKAIGVDKSTVQADLGKRKAGENPPRNGGKSPTPKPKPQDPRKDYSLRLGNLLAEAEMIADEFLANDEKVLNAARLAQAAQRTSDKWKKVAAKLKG